VDKGRGCRPAHPLGAGIAIETAMATDQGDCGTEKEALEHPDEQVEIAHKVS